MPEATLDKAVEGIMLIRDEQARARAEKTELAITARRMKAARDIEIYNEQKELQDD
jgi:hypothetical protein